MKVLSKHGLTLYFNENVLNDLRGKTLVHYKSNTLPDDISAMLVRATECGAYVEPLVSYIDCRFGLTEVELLHSGYFLHMKAFSILSSAFNRIVKRGLDLIAASALALIATPICVLTAIAIKLESPGPIFIAKRELVSSIVNLTLSSFVLCDMMLKKMEPSGQAKMMRVLHELVHSLGKHE